MGSAVPIGFGCTGWPAIAYDPSPQIRKHVAKALRRLEAWSLLDEMAAAYPDDDKIQWFANAPTTHRPFAERLEELHTQRRRLARR